MKANKHNQKQQERPDKPKSTQNNRTQQQDTTTADQQTPQQTTKQDTTINRKKNTFPNYIKDHALLGDALDGAILVLEWGGIVSSWRVTERAKAAADDPGTIVWTL